MTDDKRHRPDRLAGGSALPNPTSVAGGQILNTVKSGSGMAGRKTRKAVKPAKKAVPARAAAGRAARRNENTEEGTGKQSVSMPAETLRLVRQLADAEGVSVSRWMTQAADERATRERRAAATRAYGAEYLAEYEAEHGPISDEARAAARRALGLDDETAAAA
jgi:hypothetical protein